MMWKNLPRRRRQLRRRANQCQERVSVRPHLFPPSHRWLLWPSGCTDYLRLSTRLQLVEHLSPYCEPTALIRHARLSFCNAKRNHPREGDDVRLSSQDEIPRFSFCVVLSSRDFMPIPSKPRRGRRKP